MPFSALQEKDFLGRRDEVTDLTKRVLLARGGTAQSAVLSGHRGMGRTELLKQLFSRFFWRQDGVAPFFHTVNPALLSAQAFSRSYLTQFLCQRLAYQNKEQTLLYLDGISLADASSLAEDRGAAWASEILDQYERSSGDPVDALRLALNAPYRSALATGVPVVVLLDEFQRLKDIQLEGTPEPRLVALFEEPMSSGKTPHLITGNSPELQEMTVSSGLERIPLPPLGPESMSVKAQALLSAQGIEGAVPSLLLRHLGGNPFFLTCVVKAACAKHSPEDKDFWNAYIREIREGALFTSRSAILKSFFPDMTMRKSALAAAYMISHATEPLSSKRIAKSLGLTDIEARQTLQALYLAGFIRGEFGVLRAAEDRVVRDIIEGLYLKEILAKSAQQQEKHFLDTLLPKQESSSVRYDMTIPMVGESELVVAQCLEQIGKNLHLDEEVIGQLQIAVIEACINAIEYGKGTDDTVRIAVAADRDRLSVSIDSAGPEFIMQETGEPFTNQAAAKASSRGWGIKLMKRFADEVTFERIPGGTRTVLIKKLGTSAGVRKEDTEHHG
jgi:anti-sigma regulatory factor (Ser/Thr protein kinase)